MAGCIWVLTRMKKQVNQTMWPRITVGVNLSKSSSPATKICNKNANLRNHQIPKNMREVMKMFGRWLPGWPRYLGLDLQAL